MLYRTCDVREYSEMGPLLAFAVACLGVSFRNKNTWVDKPHAKIKVIAKGPVCPELVRLHVIELKEVALMMLALESKRNLPGDCAEVKVVRGFSGNCPPQGPICPWARPA